jgi:hypothetical protein
MKHTLFIALQLTSIFCFAQTKTFRWSFDCTYEGVYDERKISEKQIQDTYALCFTNISFLNGYGLSSSPMDYKVDILDSLTKEYHERKNIIENLDIIKSPYWKKIKEENLAYMQGFFEAESIAILSYRNPLILKVYHGAGDCKYADAIIAGGDSMLIAWKNLIEENCLKYNGNPAKCIKENYMDKYLLGDKYEYAHIGLILFGWWNICVLRHLPTLTPPAAVHPEFMKLFKRVKKLGCDGEY